jgi:hypothetical protein
MYTFLGNAIDCYRTYESILLGAIPVLDDFSPMLTQNVFWEAPTVVLRRDWKVVKPKLLKMWELNPSVGKGKSVVLGQYWLDQIDAVRVGEMDR